MWPGPHSAGDAWVSPAINNHQGRTRNAIGPRNWSSHVACSRNWSTIMWSAPIGWWRRVSPAIYTTRTQDLGHAFGRSFSFGSLVSSHVTVSTPSCTGSTVSLQVCSPCLWEPSSRVSAPHYIPFRNVLPWSQPNLEPGGLERPVMCDTRVLCTENM